MKYAIGIDVGGTFIKGGLVSERGEIVLRGKVETKVDEGAYEIEERIFRLFCDLKKEKVIGAGIGVPGMVKVEDGIVVKSPNIPVWKNYEAGKRLREKLELEVVVDNDANLAAMGEWWKGAGKGIDSFLMITLGTGIGAGIILNGRIWHGDSGRAGEFGHIIVEPDGEVCGCGSRGCVERYASADGIRRIARGFGLGGDVPDFIKLAKEGNRNAMKVFEMAGKSLAIALSNWFNIMDVKNVIVGGGAAPALDMMLKFMQNVFEYSVYGISVDELKIQKAQLGEDAGVIGAAGYFFNANKGKV